MQDINIETSFIGIDIGGTNNKIVALTRSKLLIESKVNLEVQIKKQKYYLLAHSIHDYKSFNAFLEEIRKHIGSTIKLVGTGGGTMLETKSISQIFGTQLNPMSQFDAHAKGLELYKQANLPVVLQNFVKQPHQIVKVVQTKSTLQHYDQVLFMSLGSGVNFQLYGVGENGFERKPAKDPSLTHGDGFFLQGTSLGAGFLMGLGKVSTGQKQYSTILSKLREQSEQKDYYIAFFVNLMQMALNVSVLHEQKYIVVSGGLMAFEKDISPYFTKALELYLGLSSIERTLIRLDVLQGYLGALGALYTAMN